jgi:prepilin-type N-terminal cleavage/methylation domain-containing protein
MECNKSKKLSSWLNEAGVTLVELLVTIAILGIIGAAAIPLLSSALNAHEQGEARSSLLQEGLMAMGRMSSGVRKCTFLIIPNQHKQNRRILAFSGAINDDNDFYFNDPLFPRIDEDLWRDMNDDGQSGISGLDDDGDGNVDETFFGSYDYDDDEDGVENEDGFDGIDNDGDGNIDEDTWADLNMDWEDGIKGMDDDGDGTVDEGHENDDDEDGQQDEDPLNEVIYSYNDVTRTLTESIPHTSETTVLSTNVLNFLVKYETSGAVSIKLNLIGADGEVIDFDEFVYPRNLLQKTGKRVR